jgi:hypothetical protein
MLDPSGIQCLLCGTGIGDEDAKTLRQPGQMSWYASPGM